MKVVLLTIFSLVSQFVYNETVLHIYLNTKVCSSCNLLTPGLNKLKKYGIKKIYFIEESDYHIGKEILESFSLDTINSDIKPVPDKFFVKNGKNIESYILVFHQNIQIDSFNARNLLQKISNIESLIQSDKNNIETISEKKYTLNTQINQHESTSSDSIIEIKFPEIIKFSTNFKHYLNKDKIIIMDENLNKYIFFSFDINRKSVQLLEEFKFGNIKNDSVLDIGCIDKKMFKLTEDFLIEYGKGKPKVEYVCYHDEKIFSIFSLGCPFIGSMGDTTVSSKFFCRIKDLKNKKEEIYCIEKDGITNRQFLDNSYFLSIIFMVPHDDYILIPPFTPDRTKKSFHLKYVFDKKNKLLVYDGCSENLKNRIPDPNFTFELKNKEYIFKISNPDFQFLIKYPVIYEIKTKKYHVFNSKDLIENLKKGDVLFDIAYHNNTIWKFLMYSNREDKCYICYFDTSNDKIHSIKNLRLTANDFNFGFPKFYNKDYILTLSNQAIKIFKIL